MCGSNFYESDFICSSCRNYIVFREDLNPDYENLDSLAETLNSDVTQTSKPKIRDSLNAKLQSTNARTNQHDQKSLNILKKISYRLVGMGSLYFPKIPKITSWSYKKNVGRCEQKRTKKS